VQNTINGGVTYLLTDDIQLDINAGVGLDSETDNFIGTGISIRFCTFSIRNFITDSKQTASPASFFNNKYQDTFCMNSN
jgi:hypothetical protein